MTSNHELFSLALIIYRNLTRRNKAFFRRIAYLASQAKGYCYEKIENIGKKLIFNGYGKNIGKTQSKEASRQLAKLGLFERTRANMRATYDTRLTEIGVLVYGMILENFPIVESISCVSKNIENRPSELKKTDPQSEKNRPSCFEKPTLSYKTDRDQIKQPNKIARGPVDNLLAQLPMLVGCNLSSKPSGIDDKIWFMLKDKPQDIRNYCLNALEKAKSSGDIKDDLKYIEGVLRRIEKIEERHTMNDAAIRQQDKERAQRLEDQTRQRIREENAINIGTLEERKAQLLLNRKNWKAIFPERRAAHYV